MKILSRSISALNVCESPKFPRFKRNGGGSTNTMVKSDLTAQVEIWPFRACAMHPATIGTVRSLWTWLWGRYHVPQNVFLVGSNVSSPQKMTGELQDFSEPFSGQKMRFRFAPVWAKNPGIGFGFYRAAWNANAVQRSEFFPSVCPSVCPLHA